MTNRREGGGGFEVLRRGLEALKRDLEAGRVSQRKALAELLGDLPEVLVHIEAYVAEQYDAILREIREQQHRPARKRTPQAKKASGPPKARPRS
jgi:hypothetical protein